MFLRLVLTTGIHDTPTLPANFDFHAAISRVRSDNYFLGDGMYIPHDSIICAYLVQDDTSRLPTELSETPKGVMN